VSSYQHYLTTLSAAENLDTIIDLEGSHQPLYHDLTKESLAYFNSNIFGKNDSTNHTSNLNQYGLNINTSEIEIDRFQPV